MSDLLPDAVEVVPPAGEQLVEAVPVLLGEGPVHGGGHNHALVGLVQLGANQLGLENCNERRVSTLESVGTQPCSGKVMAKDSDFGSAALGNKEALARKCQN